MLVKFLSYIGDQTDINVYSVPITYIDGKKKSRNL